MEAYEFIKLYQDDFPGRVFPKIQMLLVTPQLFCFSIIASKILIIHKIHYK